MDSGGLLVPHDFADLLPVVQCLVIANAEIIVIIDGVDQCISMGHFHLGGIKFIGEVLVLTRVQRYVLTHLADAVDLLLNEALVPDVRLVWIGIPGVLAEHVAHFVKALSAHVA